MFSKKLHEVSQYFSEHGFLGVSDLIFDLILYFFQS